MDEYTNGREFLAVIESADESDLDPDWSIVDALAVDTLERALSSRSQRLGRKADDNAWDWLAMRCRSRDLERHNVAADDPTAWYEVVVSGQPSTDSIEAEVILLGDTEGEEVPKVWIRSVRRADPRLSDELTEWAMLKAEPRSQEGHIAQLLNAVTDGAGDIAVAAYDVGQGNCNAIVDRHEHPRVFYDLGWPPSFHAASRPRPRPDFFSCERETTAPVVLSHWDMDHWAYAVATTSLNRLRLRAELQWNSAAIQRTWIARAPREEAHKLTPIHMKFFQALQGSGSDTAIRLWPDRVQRIVFRHGWIDACEPLDGSPGDRNNSGLAMFVMNRLGHTILLPGDADYGSIPALLGFTRASFGSLYGALDAWVRMRFDEVLSHSIAAFGRPQLVGLVASHHGGRIGGLHMPTPLAGSRATLVLSVGRPNSYGHPKEAALSAYAARSWIQHRTTDRMGCPAAHSHQLGNRLLQFPMTPPARCGCGCVVGGRLCLSEVRYHPAADAPTSPATSAAPSPTGVSAKPARVAARSRRG